MRIIRCLCLSSLLLSCSTLVKPPIELPVSKDAAAKSWSYVLKTYVDDKGRIDFKRLAQKMGHLEKYVSYIAQKSPPSHPSYFETPESKMAYYLNSYNALAMYGVIHSGIPKDFDGFFKRLSFFVSKQYIIGGNQISLYDYENDLIRKLGDPRVHFALNCMSVGCPRLPQAPYTAKNLNKELEDGAIEFFNSSKYVRIDSTKKTAHISEILKFFTEDFVNPRQSPNIIAYVNKYRKNTIPENYKVAFIDYDWTVNQK